MTTRGVRNCNPGNIRLTNGVPFIGQVAKSTDNTFKQFISMTFGVRALMKLLISYYRNYNCKTVRSVISRYAPSIENHTDKYIDFVCKYMHTESDTVLRLDIKHDLFPLVCAICKYESNFVPSESMLIDAFLRL